MLFFFSVAKKLCLKGAKADKLIDGITALHLLSGHESQEASDILEVCLKQAECNPNIKSIEGLTPVHVAALWGRYRNLEILTASGGNIKETDDEGNDALDFAEDTKCIKLLLELESSRENHISANALQEQNAGVNEHPDCVIKTINENDSEFSESFYTAIDDGSVLDRTVVTFPKLHPWDVRPPSTSDLDDTMLDSFNGLGISRYSFVDDQTFEDTTSGQRAFEQQNFHENDSITEDLASELGDTTIFYDWKECSTVFDQSILNDTVIVPENLRKLSDSELRKELLKYGEIPGPIMPSTRNVYIKRLARLHSGAANSKDTQYKEYVPELRKHLEGGAATPDLFACEESMCIEFDRKKNWREGTEKSSFNYLLIDPRVTQNLPARAKKMTTEDIFRVFIMSIFYVGKGKRSRPYAHLNEALNSAKQNPKIQQIKDIWAAGQGVVSLHIFQSVIPVEAYTREACMIDALGLPRLTNKKRGDYYGRAQTWPQSKRREMGVFLLKRALKILLNEGERQLRPGDLRVTQTS